MKQIFSDRIVTVPGTLLDDDTYVFRIPAHVEGTRRVDLTSIYRAYADRVDPHYESGRYDERLPPHIELDLFRRIYTDSMRQDIRVHIEPVSIRETVELVHHLYHDLGYYRADLNTFVPDLANCPVTIGARIENVVFSWKDMYQLKNASTILPPLREPRHQKSLFHGINSGIVSTLSLSQDRDENIKLLTHLITSEKISLLRLGHVLMTHYEAMGLATAVEEIVVDTRSARMTYAHAEDTQEEG